MGISIWQLLIILAIVLLLFGTKRLKNMGGDIGGAIKNFKSSVNNEDDKPTDSDKPEDKPKDN
jgi:sec-independent protein translocase protein TatA|tara:strand:- start:1826 stop:2014 length:189 start_codon:yes stop_codon:yes gene_type:complete